MTEQRISQTQRGTHLPAGRAGQVGQVRPGEVRGERLLALAIELAAGDVTFQFLVGEIGHVRAGQCRRLANDIVGRRDQASPGQDPPEGAADKDGGGEGQS